MVVGVIAIAASVLQEQGILNLGKDQADSPSIESSSISNRDRTILANAIEQKKNDVQVKGVGRVIKVLKDDIEGSRHQRFLIDIGNNQTLLVAHNIDLAPRVKSLSEGDQIEFYGEYESNNKGGVIHWTHHDPAGRHIGGWLKHNGKTYQ
ncbi:MAG: DUF3465 domain-containing protein [Cellvibrionaceae bacterium]